MRKVFYNYTQAIDISLVIGQINNKMGFFIDIQNTWLIFYLSN